MSTDQPQPTPSAATPAASTTSLRELFTKALELWRTNQDNSADDLWEIVSEAATHGRQAYDIGLHFIKSPDAAQRIVACDILAMVAVQNPAAGEGVARGLLNLLQNETDERVLWAILVALGPTGTHTALSPLIAWIDNENPDLRCQAVQAAALVMERAGVTDDGVAALIAAMEDPDRAVGYWATVSIASTLEVEGELVYNALSKRLFDLDDDIRNEAIVGLAHRKDPRMRITLEQALLSPTPSSRIFDAVEEYGSPELVPVLEQADSSSITPARLQQIIAACTPQP